MATVEEKSRTINKRDVGIYTFFSNYWWKKDGPYSGLKNMNKIRVPLIRDTLIESGVATKNLDNGSKPLQGLAILDVGCGGGFLSEELAELGCAVVGIDVCPAQIIMAKEHAALNPSLTNLSYYNHCIEQHGKYNFEKYDAVIASEVIDHVNEPELFLEGCVKCLKAGGLIFVSTFNRTLISWLYSIVILEYVTNSIPRGTHEWKRFFLPSEITNILEKDKCKTMYVRGMKRTISKIWSWSWFQCFNYFLCAKKAA